MTHNKTKYNFDETTGFYGAQNVALEQFEELLNEPKTSEAATADAA